MAKCVAQEWCCGEGGNCCPGQQNCCDDGYHCCPKKTCCADDENCLYKDWCCPKDKETCGQPDFCLADDQICCDGSPDGFCDSGYDCLKTSNGSAACCMPGKKPCNGGYCKWYSQMTSMFPVHSCHFRLRRRVHVRWRRDLSSTCVFHHFDNSSTADID